MSALPVDLTVLTAGLTLLFCLAAILRKGQAPPSGLAAIGLLWLCFLPPVAWTEWSLYGEEKVFKLFTLTLLAAVAPFFLLRTREDLGAFCWALIVGGIAMTAGGAMSLITGGLESARLTAYGSNTIALGRGCGLALVGLALLALERRVALVVALPIIAVAGFILVCSGSRGPLLVVGGLLAFMGVMFYRRRLLSLLAVVSLVAGVLAFGLATFPEVFPQASLLRIQNFMSGDLGRSELGRVDFYQASWETIQASPRGLGWGGFAHYLGATGGQEREYPHNHFLELFLEGGWLTGLVALALYGLALRRYLATRLSAEERVVLAFFLFSIANAMVSGDVNDNKLLFALLAVGLSPAIGRTRATWVRKVKGGRGPWRLAPGREAVRG